MGSASLHQGVLLIAHPLLPVPPSAVAGTAAQEQHVFPDAQSDNSGKGIRLSRSIEGDRGPSCTDGPRSVVPAW